MAEKQKQKGPTEARVQLVIDHPIPYAKVDAFQACRLNEAFALSAFQFDYQAVATGLSKAGTSAEALPARLVARLVMDRDAFKRLRDEVTKILDKVESGD
jgi:hypothetical protein